MQYFISNIKTKLLQFQIAYSAVRLSYSLVIMCGSDFKPLGQIIQII